MAFPIFTDSLSLWRSVRLSLVGGAGGGGFDDATLFPGALLVLRYILFALLVSLSLESAHDSHLLLGRLRLPRSPMGPTFFSLYYLRWSQCFPTHLPLAPVSYLACHLTIPQISL